MTTLESDRGSHHVDGARLLLAVAVWAVASLGVGYATYRFLPATLPEWAGDIGRLSAVIVAEVYALLIIALVAAMGGLAGARDRLRILPSSVQQVGLVVGLWAGAYVVAFAIYFLLSRVLQQFPSPSELVGFLVFIGTDMGRLQDADPATWALVIARACVLAPVGEELLFRGALFGWLRRRLAAWPTIGLTAVAFAAIHGSMTLTMVPLAFMVGLAAGYARERVGSLTPLIAAHLAQNVLVEAAGIASLS